jgi:hypothetical protein
MAKMNGQRVVLGGVAAGVVAFVLTGIVNGGIIARQIQAWAETTRGVLHPPAQPIALALWALMSLVLGIAGIWLYAAIRPRFGAGPKTALLAGCSVWVMNKLAVGLDFTALGIFPPTLLLALEIGGLAALLGGVLVGARLYNE